MTRPSDGPAQSTHLPLDTRTPWGSWENKVPQPCWNVVPRSEETWLRQGHEKKNDCRARFPELCFYPGTRRLEIQPRGFMWGIKGRPETQTVPGGDIWDKTAQSHTLSYTICPALLSQDNGSSGLQGRWRDRCFAVALPSAVATTGHAPLLRPTPT